MKKIALAVVLFATTSASTQTHRTYTTIFPLSENPISEGGNWICRWGPDQTVQATVYSEHPNDNIYEEVELRLRSSLSSHWASGYEIIFRSSKTKNAYSEIVRWN